MTGPEIPEEAVEPVAKAIYEAPHDGLSRNGYDAAPREIQDIYRAEARLAVAAALPHLRVQETREDGLREALLGKMAALVERAEDGEPHLFLNVSLADLEDLLAAHPAPHPRPVVDRDRVAAVLRDHTWIPSESRCSCGDEYIEFVTHHQAEAVLALLSGG